MLRLKIVNWATTADGCVHTYGRTQLDFVVVSAYLFRLVETVSTRQLSCVGVGGVYWVSGFDLDVKLCVSACFAFF